MNHPSRAQNSSLPQGQPQEPDKMSMLAMVTPAPHAPFRRDYSWHDARSSDLASSRPRTDPEKIALPSIRQAFPELQLRLVVESPGAPSTTTSPIVGLPGAMTPPEYVHSPNSNKRRRLSMDDDREERLSQVPRLYSTSSRAAQQQRQQGGAASPLLAPRPGADSWGSSSRTSPFLPPSAGLPSIRSPVAMEPTNRGEGIRPTLANLPRLALERDSTSMVRVRGHSSDDYAQAAGRPLVAQPSVPGVDPADRSYRQGAYSVGYHHPTRLQSLSLGAIHPFERSSFSAAGYGPYQEYMRIGELGAMGLNGENKQRKRRGNLPKETTDKLRGWFTSHLHHPYPTEDEKQELMRQTGLQMNQISNWFINARRRQLPAMINNARVESDATSGRSADGGVLASTERSDYGTGKRDSPSSEDEGSHFEDELVAPEHQRAGHMKRGSV